MPRWPNTKPTKRGKNSKQESSVSPQQKSPEQTESSSKLGKNQLEDPVYSRVVGMAGRTDIPARVVEQILEERGSRYGNFITQGRISQDLKMIMMETCGWPRLTPSQREALDMIQHKIARILNGDPNYVDSWTDIAGYAQLIVKELTPSGPGQN